MGELQSHEWKVMNAKYQLLFLSKHTQTFIKMMFKLLVFKSTNNFFTNSPIRFLLVIFLPKGIN
jgi:hypothetical protein